MSGKVYMFNNNFEEMSRIQIRTFSAPATIKGWSTDAANRYTPFAMAIDRFKLDEDRFGFKQGDNMVTFSRPTYNGNFRLMINPDIPLSDDLVLYVMREKAFLMRTNGEIIEEVSFAPMFLKA
jgi:hypothetical protein